MSRKIIGKMFTYARLSNNTLHVFYMPEKGTLQYQLQHLRSKYPEKVVTDPKEIEKFKDFGEVDYIRYLNKKEYYRISKRIQQLKTKQQIMDKEAKKVIQNEINRLRASLDLPGNWLVTSGYEEDLNPTVTGMGYTEREAFDLLQNLENNDYARTVREKEMMKGSTFPKWTSIFLNKNDSIIKRFDLAFEELLTQGQLSHQKFYRMTKSSKWFKKKYFGSFVYHCTHKNGRYFKQKREKKLIRESYLSDDSGKDKQKYFFLR